MCEKKCFYRVARLVVAFAWMVPFFVGCGGGGGGISLQHPVARAGGDREVQQGDLLMLDGSASYDVDGQIISYRWEENGTLLGNSKVLNLHTLAPGTHTITLTVEDNDHLAASDTLTVTVWSWDIFAFCTYTYGCEPYRLGGDGKRLTLLKDIDPTTADANPTGFQIMGSALYFFAFDAEGTGLFKIDQGAYPTPQKVKSFPYDISMFYSNQYFQKETIVMNGSLYFFILDYSTLKTEFWKSNGSISGTSKIGTFSTYLPTQLTRVGNKIFFVMNDGHNGSEVWVSDGSYNGTHMVSIVQDDTKGDPKDLTAYNGQLYFVANDGATGYELWRTNGTPVGTAQVADINPGAGDAGVHGLTVSGGKLYFAANDGTHGDELWAYDGSSVSMVKDINPNTPSSKPAELTDVGGTLYFTARDGTHGDELWSSDGTTGGTSLYYDLILGPQGSHPKELTAQGNSLYYVAMREGFGRNIFKDKDSMHTSFDSLYGDDFHPRNLISNGVSLSFVAGYAQTGLEPFTGSNPWANEIADIAEGIAGSNPHWLGYNAMGNYLYFSADDNVHGRELWMSDGSTLGTYMIDDIAASGSGSTYKTPVKVDGISYFVATDSQNRQKLYRSDGSTSGTYAVQSMDNFRWMIPFKHQLFFADDHSIYATDGTVSGTSLYQPSQQLSYINFKTDPVVFHDKLYFIGMTQTHGLELYSIDGANSLERVSDFSPSDPNFSALAVMGDSLYFAANDGAAHGTELWKSDGTLGGISIVKDIVQGTGSSLPKSLTVFKNKLYFTATTPLKGREIWVSDGSSAHTVMLADIATQVGVSSNPEELTVSGDRLYFVASGTMNGRELWRTDGIPNHTLPVADIRPGQQGSDPKILFGWEGHVVFSADDGTNGRKLWMLPSGTEAPWMSSTTPNQKGIFAFKPWNILGLLDHKLFYQDLQSDGTELWVTDGTESGTKMLWKEQW